MTDTPKLYGSEISYYTGKVRSYFRFKGISFEEIKATPEAYHKVIIPLTGVRYIPVAVTGDGVAIQDSTDIIDYFEERDPDRSIYPVSPRQRLVALLMELYGDEWLKLPAMHYRWAYNYDYIVGEFGKAILPGAPEAEQREAAADRVAFFSGSRPHLGITEQTAPAIEAWYEEFLTDLDAHFADHDFLLGDRPSIGDFGLYGPLYAHLYRDPQSGALMKRIAPWVAAWVERMTEPTGRGGDFLGDDVVPETLTPILRRMFDEHLPVMAGTVDKVAQWVEANPDQELPRGIGTHRFKIGGVTGERVVFPYVQWMLQRPLDFYHSTVGDARNALNTFLEKTGGATLADLDLRNRLVRRKNKLFKE